MLLDVVALARDKGCHDTARGKPDTRRLALARVGLLGLGHAHLETHALEHGAFLLRQRRRDGMASPAGFSTALCFYFVIFYYFLIDFEVLFFVSIELFVFLMFDSEVFDYWFLVIEAVFCLVEVFL